MAMAKKGKVKRQHFVPRCLLRRFSQGDRTTSVFVIGTAKFVHTAGIKTQCAADYYYGHEQTTETALGQLEGAFSEAIGDLSPEKIEGMSEQDLAVIRSFVHVQAERTPLAGQVHRMAYADMGRQLFAAYAKVNGLPDHDINEQGELFADHQMPVPGAHTVALAVEHQAAIADLDVKFVTGEGFMISDHPALALNVWRDEHPRFSRWPHGGGLMTKGFMYLMPVATDCLLAVYDGDTYQVGEDGSRVAYATPGDVLAVNALQTVNATRLLFDSTVVMPLDLIAALDVRNRIRAEAGEGPISLHLAGIPLTFLKVIDDVCYEDWDRLMLPCRRGLGPNLAPAP